MTQEHKTTPLWQSEQYSLYPDHVVQAQHSARALSSTKMISHYRSPANAFLSPRIRFKFSINNKDNEMITGRDHHFNCLPSEGNCETPLIRFGQQFVDATPVPSNTYLPPNTKLTLRLDMRQVLADFEEKGFYRTFKGDKIYREDFKGVFVAGSAAPLIWDFDNLASHPELELKDPEGDGIYEVTLLLNAYLEEKETESHWELSRDISAHPHYSSDYPLQEALYNMAVEEMQRDVEADNTFRTGAEWAGVWTRDVSYSIILSMAILQPEVSRNSLMRKVKDGRIVQDTGTGGAYPVSTDRIVWAIAAWELYQVNGDQEWLKAAYPIIRDTMEDDLRNAYDEKTSLFRGESSFLDWREQTYPGWMESVDIYASECLGTNAVFYQAAVILAKMADRLGDQPAEEKYLQLAEEIKTGINRHLWMPEHGYYGQYLYGRKFLLRSPRAEALGEALCVLFGIADPDRQKTVVSHTPVTPYGIPCIYPQIPNVPPYHNNGIWPFVQAYWSLAAAKAGNEGALMESLSAIYRPAAFFLTNKENFVASNGDYVGTEINSDCMLWSISGNLAMVYKVIFGLDFHPDHLAFKPFVPKALSGDHKLANVTFRDAVLDIHLTGYGNMIQTFLLDGDEQKPAEIPAGLTGRHSIHITLANNQLAEQEANLRPVHMSPLAPSLTCEDQCLRWDAQGEVQEYLIFRNGQQVAATEQTAYELPTGSDDYAEYQVVAVDPLGYASFASEPLGVGGKEFQQIYQMEEVADKADYPYKGFSGSGFVELSKKKNTDITIAVQVQEDGLYAIDFRYANGNGPVNTGNKAAIRTLKKEEFFVGTVIFPQRGKDEWSEWGFTNTVLVELAKGRHNLSLAFESVNENMNGEVNQAMVDCMRLTKVK